jgi:hypothetical protein
MRNGVKFLRFPVSPCLRFAIFPVPCPLSFPFAIRCRFPPLLRFPVSPFPRFIVSPVPWSRCPVVLQSSCPLPHVPCPIRFYALRFTHYDLRLTLLTNHPNPASSKTAAAGSDVG